MAEDGGPDGPSLDQPNRRTSVQASFAGPLPPPAILDGYEVVVPGAAERILQMAEKEQAQSHALQKSVVAQQILEGRIARWSAFALPALGLGVALAMTLGGSEVAGGAVGVAALGAPLVGAILKKAE